MTNLSIFNFQNNSLRVIIKPSCDSFYNPIDDIWFVAKDVCNALEIDMRTIFNILDKEDICLESIQTSGGVQKMTVITESSFFILALQSRKESLRTFQKYVTKQILPTVVKKGYFDVNKDYDLLRSKFRFENVPNKEFILKSLELSKEIDLPCYNFGNLPKFVKIENTALRLKKDKYYRDAGCWSVGYKIVNGLLLSQSAHENLDNKQLIPITKEDWQKENEGYAPFFV
jgi:prophage antirepressor-like protein